MSEIIVQIPAPLRKIVGGNTKLTATGGRITDVISAIDQQFPGFRSRLTDDSGEIRQYIKVFVNKQQVNGQERSTTEVPEGGQLTFMLALAGG